jgi:RNA polymerase sigma-70 factor (ECF subfamily)
VTDPFAEELIAHLPRLRRFAIILARSRDVADDLVQTACEKALASRSQFVPGTRMDAWLFRILRNAHHDRLRQLRNEGPAENVDDMYYLVGADGAKITAERLALAETAKAIGQLPEKLRVVLLLVSVEDLSYAETAQILDVPIGTVMSRISRARAKLNELLESRR